jgi:hypothetical protein
VLLVHSNSKWHDISIFPWLGLIRTHPTSAPSSVLEPSKNMVHMSGILVLLVELNPKLVNIVQVLLWIHGRSPNCNYNGISDVCAS